jgi:PAS domain S-box-containing protein
MEMKVDRLALDIFSSPELLFKIFNSNQFAIAISDHAGQIISANPLFNETAVLVPKPVSLVNLIQETASFTFKENHSPNLHHDTGRGRIRLSYFKLPDTNEKQVLWLASSENGGHKLSVLKNLYRSFVDTSFELLCRTSADGKLIFASRLFVTRFGFENYRQIKGKQIDLIFEDPSDYQRIENRLLKGERISSETFFFRSVDGSRMTGLVNCHSRPDESGVLIFNWTILDVSRHAETEKALKAKNDQLAKVNQQMEKFLYATSHDLRSPLTSILGLVNIMRMETKDTAILEYVSKVESSTMKLDKIIRDIMSFSKTNYQRTTSEKIDFETLVWKTLNGHRSNPALRKIHFEVNFKGDFPFFNDEEKIEIIVDNIIHNSISFYDANKGHCFIKVIITIEKERALLEVIDNGIGIGQQHFDHIFTLFYKASHHSKGAGLGLFIVKETLEKLDGSITVESEIGFGTVMRIIIPNDHKGRLIARKLQLQNKS